MQAASEAVQQMPIFIGHGADDQLVPVTLSTRTAEGLRKAGAVQQALCHCVLAEGDDEHQICEIYEICDVHRASPSSCPLPCRPDWVQNAAIILRGVCRVPSQSNCVLRT